LVEIMLRMLVRSTVAARTGTLSSRDMNEASNTTAATIPIAQTSHRWRPKKPVLLPVNAMLAECD
jgi:hypothetical protein